MRSHKITKKKRSYQKGGSPIGLSPYPARQKDFPTASATTRSTNAW